MLQFYSRRWLILPLICISFDGMLVAGQDQSGRLDVLKGNHGEDSCQLRDTIHSTCNLVTSPPPLNVNPIPSRCTCNKVYFNIWSACSYATGNSTLPIFQNWTQTCTNSNVDLDSSTATANTNGGLGIDIPAWSLLDIPGNQDFDIQRAVSIVSSSTAKWSKFQILAPVISAVVAVLMTFVFVFYCRPRADRTESWRGRVRDWVRPVPKMKPVDLPTVGRNWAIDELYESTRIPPPMIDPLSPIETNRITDISVPGNPSAAPSRYGSLSKANGDPVGSDMPEERVYYPFAPRYPLNTPQVSQPPSAPTSTTASLLRRIPKNIRMPWKPRPTPIRVIQPNGRFRVDHRQESLQAMSSAGGTQEDSITSWGPERPRGSFDVHEHEDSQENMNVGMENQTDDQASDEGTSLITQSQRERMSMQTSQAHSNSINSHVNIVAPSNSTSSPRDSRFGGTPFPFVNRNPPPVVPPPPMQPAPLPPSGQRTIKREYIIGQLPPDRLMATIQESRPPSPLIVQPISHRPQPSIDSPPRPLPRPASTSPLSQSDLLSPRQWSTSQTGSASSVYEENSMTGYTPSNGSRPPHSRSGSGDSQTSAHRSRPLPTHTNNNIPLPNRGMSQSNYPPSPLSHQRSGSGSSFSATNVYQDPFTPNGHGRGLDSELDDDGASFYLESTEPSTRAVRSPSPDVNEMLGDPSMLFHPSVRGAGYRGTPP